MNIRKYANSVAIDVTNFPIPAWSISHLVRFTLVLFQLRILLGSSGRATNQTHRRRLSSAGGRNRWCFQLKWVGEDTIVVSWRNRSWVSKVSEKHTLQWEKSESGGEGIKRIRKRTREFQELRKRNRDEKRRGGNQEIMKCEGRLWETRREGYMSLQREREKRKCLLFSSRINFFPRDLMKAREITSQIE